MTAPPRSGRRPAVSMILPEFERSSGEILRRLFLRDVRVPRPFSFEQPPRLLGTYDKSEHCSDGRHLWDAIVATGECAYDEDGREQQPFRLTLTCVRCGRIEGLAGVSADDSAAVGGRVPAEPLTAGGLRAQQVTCEGDLILTWHVFGPAGERVGTMQSSMTRRGRRFVEGRLDGQGAVVEAPTAVACLRKLVKSFGDAG